MSDQQLLRAINDEVKKQIKNGGEQIKLSLITTNVMNSSIVKVRPDAVGDMARYVLDQGKFVEEALSYCDITINPKELAISANWFDELCRAYGKPYPLIKLNTHLIHLDGKDVLQQVRPAPDICRSISTSDMNSAAKNLEAVDAIEKTMRDNRRLTENAIAKRVGAHNVSKWFRVFEFELTRMMYSRSLNAGQFNHGVSGKYSAEKSAKMLAKWFKFIEANCSALEGLAVEVASAHARHSTTTKCGYCSIRLSQYVRLDHMVGHSHVQD